MTAAVAAETRTSHRATRVRVAPAPAPRSLSRQVPDTVSLFNVVELRISESNNWLNDVRREYTEDLIFGPVLEYLSADGLTIPKMKKELRTRERTNSYFHEDGLLYHKLPGGKLCIPDNL